MVTIFKLNHWYYRNRQSDNMSFHLSIIWRVRIRVTLFYGREVEKMNKEHIHTFTGLCKQEKCTLLLLNIEFELLGHLQFMIMEVKKVQSIKVHVCVMEFCLAVLPTLHGVSCSITWGPTRTTPPSFTAPWWSVSSPRGFPYPPGWSSLTRSAISTFQLCPETFELLTYKVYNIYF